MFGFNLVWRTVRIYTRTLSIFIIYIYICFYYVFEGDLKIKLCGSVKYLDVKTDTNFSWKYHVNDLSIKLNRANALFFNMRKYVSLKILRSIFFAIFDSCLSYCSLVWAQNCSTIQRIVILQKKVVRIISFSTKEFPYQPPIQPKLHLKISR